MVTTLVIISIYFVMFVLSQTCTDDWSEFTVMDGTQVLFSVSKSTGETTAKTLKVNNRDLLKELDEKTQEITSLKTRMLALERYVAKLESHAMGELIAPAKTTKRTNTVTKTPVTVSCNGKELPMTCQNTSKAVV